MYPTNIPGWREALLAYQPAEDHADAIYEARGAPCTVLACVTVFNAMKAAQGMTPDGLRVLIGAAHLIAAGGWHGLAGEAAILIGQRVRDLSPADPPSVPDPA